MSDEKQETEVQKPGVKVDAVTPVPEQAIAPKPKFHLNVFPVGKELDEDTVNVLQEIESELGMPVLILLQAGDGAEFDTIGEDVYNGFLRSITDLEKDQPVSLIIESSGGYADYAYKIGKLLQRHCGGFKAVIPSRAKSAATLLALGAKNIILHRFAELGPLDAQVFDRDREQFMSALDEVQALERLNSAAMNSVDEQMVLLLTRTQKPTYKLLPQVFGFVSSLMTPLYEKIDTVHYTQTARVLKVGQEYALRLLESNYGRRMADTIAQKLTESYPDHGFVIDIDECHRLQLKAEPASPTLEAALDRLMAVAKNRTLLGRVVEIL